MKRYPKLREVIHDGSKPPKLGTMIVPTSDDAKIKAFCDYLDERIQKARFERQRPDLPDRIQAILKTEIAELEVVRAEFERLILS